MMIKTFENFNEDLVDKLLNDIEDKNKIINGYSCEYESQGAIAWYNGKYSIYATPYWEGENQLPIEVSDYEGNQIDFTIVKLEELNNVNDIEPFIKKYFDIIEKTITDIPLVIASKKYNL